MNWYKLAQSKNEIIQKLKNKGIISLDDYVDAALPLKWSQDFEKTTDANPLPHFIWIYKENGPLEGEPLPITQTGKDLLIQYNVNKRIPLKLAQEFGKEEPHNQNSLWRNTGTRNSRSSRRN